MELLTKEEVECPESNTLEHPWGDQSDDELDTLC